MKSQNMIDSCEMISGYAIAINPGVVSENMYKFIQGYNTVASRADKDESRMTSLFQHIGLGYMPAQISITLALGNFKSPQHKQTFGISCKRFTRSNYPGKALVINGTSCSIYTLANDETTDLKGKVVKLKSQQEIDAKLAADKKAADEKSELLLSAEQTKIKLENVQAEKLQAENNAANATKKLSDSERIVNEVKKKSETELALLKAENEKLKIEIEKYKHESAMTIREYNELKTMIMGKVTLQALRAKVGGVTLKSNKPEFTNKQLNQVVNC
jgi:hypothetical protein